MLIAVSCLLADLCQGGIKDLGSHFSPPSPQPDLNPRSLGKGGALEGVQDVEALPLDFHQENTVTSDIPLEGYEDEDYIDFDKILAEGGDDYRCGGWREAHNNLHTHTCTQTTIICE